MFRCTTLMQSRSYLRVLEVMSPQGSDLVLATHIPNSKTDIFIVYSLHIETFTGKKEAGLKFTVHGFDTRKYNIRRKYNNLSQCLSYISYFSSKVLHKCRERENNSKITIFLTTPDIYPNIYSIHCGCSDVD